MSVFDIIRNRLNTEIRRRKGLSLWGDSFSSGLKKSVEIVNSVEKEYNSKYEPIQDVLEFGVDGFNQHLKEQYRRGYEDGLNADRWIPVTPDTMPLFGQCVLATVDPALVDSNNVILTKYKGEDYWNYIIAWQPVPVGYVKKEAEK